MMLCRHVFIDTKQTPAVVQLDSIPIKLINFTGDAMGSNPVGGIITINFFCFCDCCLFAFARGNAFAR